ncbi:hypothetical protein ZWY2020_035955 [Hordeum vulgare]|nr:hypothetical protein ZWY2020_035955 [Hordeum vulgare]
MWRSRARALLLLRSSVPRSPPPPQNSLRSLTRAPPPPPRLLSRFLSSSSPEALPDAPSSSADALQDDPFAFAPGVEPGSADPTEADEDNLAALWEQDAGDANDIFVSPASPDTADSEASDQEVARVRAVVQSTPEDQIPSAIADMVVDFTEPLLAAILLSAENCSGKKLLLLFKSAGKNNPDVKSLANLDIVASKVADSAEIDKMDAYMLWDLVKEMGSVPGSLSTPLLNRVLAMFWKLQKSKAALEKSMVGAAWGVCEKMVSSGCFPDGKKIGEIVTFFCQGKMVTEAHSVYLAAKEKKVQIPTSALDFLVGALAKNDATITTALELLGEYKGDSLKHAGKSFAAVIHSLCRMKNVNDAKKLLMRMVNLGPAPGSAVFNFVITGLSKEGEMEDAKDLIRVMESRGLRPDVYTYSVIMSGYAKGGMIDEAHSLLREAKKIHPKPSRVTYHILIRGYCKMEEFEKALECLKEMKEDGLQPNMDEYNKLIQSLCLKAMDWRTAEKLLEEMEGSGLCLKGITRSLIAAVKELEMEEASKDSQEA